MTRWPEGSNITHLATGYKKPLRRCIVAPWEELSYEKNFPTESKTEKPDAWLPDKDALEGRESCVVSSSAKGTSSHCSVKFTPRKLTHSERLKKKSEFEEVYSKGTRLQGRFFIAFVMLKRGGPLRLGVVASRRVGGAVERNRAKRVLREAFRRNKPQKGMAGDVVLVARAAIKRARYADVEKAYVEAVHRMLQTSWDEVR